MSEVILKALGELDPAIDGQWTEDGLPTVEAVQFIAEDSTITRADISQAAPQFSRSNPSTETVVTPPSNLPGEQAGEVSDEASTSVPPSEDGTDGGASDQVVPDAPPEANDGIVADGDAVIDSEQILSQILDGQLDRRTILEKFSLAERQAVHLGIAAELGEVTSTRIELEKKIAKLQTKLTNIQVTETRLGEQFEATQPPGNESAAIRDYLASQQRLRGQRRVNNDALKEAGIDLKELGKALQMGTPLDQALNRRGNNRATQRPTRVPIIK